MTGERCPQSQTKYQTPADFSSRAPSCEHHARRMSDQAAAIAVRMATWRRRARARRAPRPGFRPGIPARRESRNRAYRPGPAVSGCAVGTGPGCDRARRRRTGRRRRMPAGSMPARRRPGAPAGRRVCQVWSLAPCPVMVVASVLGRRRILGRVAVESPGGNAPSRRPVADVAERRERFALGRRRQGRCYWRHVPLTDNVLSRNSADVASRNRYPSTTIWMEKNGLLMAIG